MNAMGRGSRVAVVALAAGVLASVPRAARAGDAAAAEVLFTEARKLMTQGRYAEACPKFAESNRLDRAPGTLILLADCYEKNKQTATAWATFKEAASVAKAANRADYQRRAQARVDALGPKLAHLVVRVASPAPGLDVKRDGLPTTEASWNLPIPVDTGEHVVEASAPARVPFRATARVEKDGDTVEVVVPALEPVAVAAPAPLPPPPVHTSVVAPATEERPASGSTQRTLGWVLVGVGAAGLAAGGVTGLVAIGANDASTSKCPDDGLCRDPQALADNDRATTFATISTVAFVAGGVLAAAGLTFVFTAPSGRSVALTPSGVRATF